MADLIPAKRLRLLLLPWLILALGLGITAVLWQNARRDAAQILETEFEFWVDKIADSIDNRLSNHMQVLRGVAGLFDASEVVTREAFRRYVAALRLEERYPGIQGVGFSLLIPPDQKAAHEAAIRQEGFPDYVIRPPGEREFYTAVIYLEPFFNRNQRAFGYDMSLEPVRWAAATRARDEGQATLSGKVTLQQETTTDIQPGFVLFVPVYRHNHPHDTLEERRTHLIGWAFSPLRMHDLMQGVLGAVEFSELRSVLDVDIYDGVHLAPDALLFALHPVTTPATPDPAFRAVRPLSFGGRPWSLQVTSTTRFEARLHSEKALIIALAGSLSSLLLALLTGILTSGQKRIAAALREAERNIAERQQAEEALQESEARFRSYFELSLIGIAITSLEKGWLEINNRLCEILGYSPAALRQKTWTELTHPDDLAADVAQFNRVLTGEMNSYSLEKRFVRQDGRVIFTEISVACVRNAAGQPLYFVALVQDITERKQAEENSRIALHRLDTLIENLYAGIVLVSDDGHVELANQAVCDLFDLAETPDELRGLRADEFLQKIQQAYVDPAAAMRRIQDIVEQGQPIKGEELPMQGGRLYIRDFIPIFIDGQRCGRLWQHVDITDRKRMEEALREQAIRDPLTGLFNRRYLDETLRRELHRCQRNGESLTVAMLDLDHFKRFNDAYGHEAGDSVLRAIGELLRRSLRIGDMACRYGGEELTLVLPGSSPEDAQPRLDDLRQRVMQMRLSYRRGELPAITVSIGIAAAEREETDAATLLSRADAALYQAKAQGRNRIIDYEKMRS